MYGRSNPSFRAVWATKVGDAVDGAVRRVAIPWLVLVATGDPLQLGVAFALYSAPDVALAPVVGHVVDHWPVRVTLGSGQFLQGGVVVAIGGLAAAGRLPLWLLYAGLVVLSAVTGLTHNARRSALPAVVAEDDLDAANATLDASRSVAGLAALLGGGTIVAALGPGVALIAGGTVPAASSLAVVSLSVASGGGDDTAADGLLAGVVATSREGLAAIRDSRTVLALLAFGLAVNLLVVPYRSVLVPTASRVLSGSPLALTALLVAFRVGDLAGTAAAGRLSWSRPRKVAAGTATVGLASMAAGLVGSSVPAAGTVGAPMPVVGEIPLALAAVAVALAVVGAGQPLFNVPTSSMLQSAAPAERRGTVVTVVNATLQSAFPLSLIAAGLALRRYSPFALFGAAGLGMVALALAVAVAVRR